MLKDMTIPLSVTQATAQNFDGEAGVMGKLYAIEYRPGTILTGATLAVTCEGETSKALLSKTNAGTTNTFYYPRDLVHAVADGAALTGTAGGDRCLPLLSGTPRVTITSGWASGAALVGSVVLYYE